MVSPEEKNEPVITDAEETSAAPSGGESAVPAAGEVTEASASQADESVDPGGGVTLALSATQSLATRLDRERRRAVRAEARLAEIELALRRTIGDSNGDGVPVGELRTLLDAVETRLAALDDELKAGERELSYLQESQRIDRSILASGAEDLSRTLEDTRRDLSDSMRYDRTGLPELARQKMEFEVEMDRLQSLLSYRDTVCEGLAEELQQGTRVTAEVTGRLADLSRGRVAAARRRPTVDARVAALRRDLEAEQGRLQQTRRALEAARAEAQAAQQTAVEADQRAADRLAAMNRERLDREREHARLQAELEHAVTEAREHEADSRRKLHESDAERHGLRLQIEALQEESTALRREVELSSDSRQSELRGRLEAAESSLEETEAERVRLAERVSLLQAALSRGGADKGGETGAAGAGRRRVLSLVRKRPVVEPQDEEKIVAEEPEGAAGAAPDAGTDKLLRERESEIDELSQRWRDLQDAYKDALTEFDDMRQKRDKLMRRLNAPGAEPGAAADGEAGTEEPGPVDLDDAPPLVIDPAQPVAPVVPGTGPDEVGGETSTGPVCLLHWDDEGERRDLVRARAEREPDCVYARNAAELPAGASPLIVLNLLSEEVDPFAALPAFAGSRGSVPVLTYCARGDRGFVLGLVEFFPAPFNPEVCAERLLLHPQNCRRVLAVGEAIEALSSLREIMGRARCSTAVAFDGGQAVELAPLVRPNFALVDLSLPAGDAMRVFRELGSSSQSQPVSFGATWTRAMDADLFRRDLEHSLGSSAYSADALESALTHALAAMGAEKRTPEA